MVNCIVVDDNPDIVNMFCDFLDMLKVNVLDTGINGLDAIKLYEKYSPDIVFIDLAMPDYDGLYAVENIKDKNQNAKIIVVTANSNDYDLHLFEVLNIPVISKPFDMKTIKETIENISLTDNIMPASFDIKYKFKEDYDHYSCKVNYEQYRNFKKLEIIEECRIIKGNIKNNKSQKEMQQALDLAVQKDTSHIRKLSEIMEK
jgi:two-component system chemotaxis response regulator CheY